MPKLGYSLILNFDIHKKDRYLIRKFAREQMVDALKDEGRTNETIEWIEGWFINGKDFPLPIEYGDAEQRLWRIIATINVTNKGE